MIRRWAARLVASTSMATLRLADRRESIPRRGSLIVRHRTLSLSGSSSNVTGGGP